MSFPSGKSRSVGQLQNECQTDAVCTTFVRHSGRICTLRCDLPLERRPLSAAVEVDDAVVGNVDPSVVIEVAMGITGSTDRPPEVEDSVVGDVDLAIEVSVSAVGVLHDDVAGADGFAVEG